MKNSETFSGKENDSLGISQTWVLLDPFLFLVGSPFTSLRTVSRISVGKHYFILTFTDAACVPLKGPFSLISLVLVNVCRASGPEQGAASASLGHSHPSLTGTRRLRDSRA